MTEQAQGRYDDIVKSVCPYEMRKVDYNKKRISLNLEYRTRKSS
jgi:hypothetical protein